MGKERRNFSKGTQGAGGGKLHRRSKSARGSEILAEKKKKRMNKQRGSWVEDAWGTFWRGDPARKKAYQKKRVWTGDEGRGIEKNG